MKYSLLIRLCLSLLMVLAFTSKASVAAEGVAADNSYMGHSKVVRKAQTNIVVKQTKQQSIVNEVVSMPEPDIGQTYVLEKVEEPSRKAGIAKTPMRKVRLPSRSDWRNNVNIKLWKLYGAGKFSALRALIRDTKIRHKGWREPKQILQLVALVEADRTLLAAQKRGDYAVALRLHKKSPQSFTCQRLGWVLFLAEGQMRAGKKAQSMASYQRVMKRCSPVEKVASLEHALGVLPADKWQGLLEVEHKKHYTGNAAKRMKLLWYKLQLQKLQYASDHGNVKVALALSRQVQADVIRYDDAGGAEILAWTFLRAEAYESALKNFIFSYKRTENPDMLRGQALAYGGSGRFAELDELTVRHKAVFEREKYIKDVLPLQANHAFMVKEYKKARRLLLELQKLRPLTMGEMSSLSWSYYHLDNFAEAAARFESLYRLKSDDEVARGLYYSLLRLGDDSKTSALADEFGGAFADFIERDKALQMYNKHHFLAAYAATDLYSDILLNIDEPYVRLAYMQRKSPGTSLVGSPRFARMNLQKIILEGRDVFSDVHELSVRLEHLSLDGFEKNLLPGAEIGTITGAAYAIKPRNVHKGNEWSLTYRHEGKGVSYLEVGQLLVPTAVKNGEWKFRLGYSRSFDDSSLQVEGYRQPVRETLLSYVGMTDPYQGVLRWGQVSRNGVNLSMYKALPLNLSVNANVLGEVRTGHLVKSNRHIAGYVGLPVNISSDKLDHLAIGPYGRLEGYQMDQNHYTVGHGGYYSPQNLVDVGLSMDLMTKTQKEWLVSASGSFGRQVVRTSVSPFFPIPSVVPALVRNKTYPAQKSIDMHYHWDVAAVLAVTDYVRLNGEYRYSRSWSTGGVNGAVNIINPSFNDHAFMLSLTVYFDKRGKQLLSTDLPSYRLSPLY